MKKIKQFFETPKKAAISIACIAAVLAVLGTGSVLAAAAIAESSSIGEEHAQNFAFADAGIDPRSATAVRTEFDFEHGQFVYEVEFIAEDTEYEYQIKASDGRVVKKEMDLINPRQTTINDENTNTIRSKEAEAHKGAAEQNANNLPSTNSDIGVEQAKSIAVKHAGFSVSEVTFSKAKLDREDGVMVYEIEFYKDRMEYEYEIHAATGEIMKYDSEHED